MTGDPKIITNEAARVDAELPVLNQSAPVDSVRVQAALQVDRNVDRQRDQMNQKIEGYLQENLPASEHRIQTPMDALCEVSIVIPAYGERDAIFRPLESLANQTPVAPQSFEAIFVINNPAGVPQRKQNMSDADYERSLAHYHTALEENQICLRIIEFINGGSDAPDLSDAERKIIDKIKTQGIKIYAIDKATPGNELPPGEANVGGARNRGVAEAAARFYEQKKSNGIIGQTDADTKLDENYVFNVIKVFHDNPAIVGIAGGLDFEQTEQGDLFENISNYSELQYNYRKVLELYLYGVSDKVEKPETKAVSFSGANMASRAFEAALVGGVPKIGGGEDPEFGRRLSQIGKIIDAPDVKVLSADRFSARTDVGAGHGQERIRLAGLLTENKGVVGEDPEYVLYLEGLRKGLQEFVAHQAGSADALKKLFTIKDAALLDDTELQLFAKKMIGVEDLASDIFLKDPELIELRTKIVERLKKIFPEESIELAAQKLIDKIVVDGGPVADKYAAIKAEMLKKEDEQREKNKKLIEKIVAIFFQHPVNTLDEDTFVQLVAERGYGADLSEIEVEKITKNHDVMNKFVDGMRGATTKEEAIAALTTSFKKKLKQSSDDPLKMRMLELNAMRQAQKEAAVA